MIGILIFVAIEILGQAVRARGTGERTLGLDSPARLARQRQPQSNTVPGRRRRVFSARLAVIWGFSGGNRRSKGSFRLQGDSRDPVFM